MTECIFCKIVNKEIPSEIVYEDDKILAFKDINPQAPVHLLIIPKEHIASIMEFNDDDLIKDIFVVIKKLAKELSLDNSGFRIVNNCGQEGGQTVYHVHFHLLGKRAMKWPPG